MKFDPIFTFNEYNREKFIKSVASQLENGTKILDVGAGSCKYKSFFSHCEYKAQDFAKYVGNGYKYGKLDYVCDINSIPVMDSSFDVIICTEVLEHVPYPELALKEFQRILKFHGKLVITAPLNSSIHMAPYHYYGGFSQYWYEHFLLKHGFEIEKIQTNGGFFKCYGQESQRFLTYLTPKDKFLKFLFLPIKMILALWFKLLIPVVCYVLDSLIKTKEYTVGYFVLARKV